MLEFFKNIKKMLPWVKDEDEEEKEPEEPPLHKALWDKAELHELPDLVGFFSMRRMDSKGNLPLHVACATCRDPDVIQYLIGLYPKAVQRKTKKTEKLPIHVMLAHKETSIEALELLIDHFPEALEEVDKGGRLPLHIAVAFKARIEILELLLERYPGSIKKKTEMRGVTPLEIACETRASLEVIQLLVEKYPAGAQKTRAFGKTNLGVAVSNHQTLPVIEFLLANHEEALTMKDSWGRTPLFRACADHAKIEIIEYLIEMHPAAVYDADKGGSLPIHAACKNGANLDVLDMLLTHYPDGIKAQDNNKDTPLHIACKANKIEIKTIEYILEKNKKAAKKFNKQGLTPVHLAAGGRGRKPSILVLRLLCEGYNELQMIIDKSKNGGQTPLHYACERQAPIEVIEVLLEKYPKACSIQDMNGQTPLHLAVVNKAKMEVLHALLKQYPYGVIETDKKGLTPLHTACQGKPYRPDVAVIELLLDRYPEGLLAQTRNGSLPLHMASRGKYAKEDIVKLVFGSYPEAAEHKNRRRKTPMDGITSEEIQKFYNSYKNRVRLAKYCWCCIRGIQESELHAPSDKGNRESLLGRVYDEELGAWVSSSRGDKEVYEGGYVEKKDIRMPAHRPTINYTPSERLLDTKPAKKKRTQTIDYQASSANLNFEASKNSLT